MKMEDVHFAQKRFLMIYVLLVVSTLIMFIVAWKLFSDTSIEKIATVLLFFDCVSALLLSSLLLPKCPYCKKQMVITDNERLEQTKLCKNCNKKIIHD